MSAEWSGPPYTFNSGKKPKNCFRDPKSPFWQYDFQLKGVRERGSTGYETARDAEDFVMARRTAVAADAQSQTLSAVAAAGFGPSVAHKTAKPEILFSEALATLIEDQGLSGKDLSRALYESKQLVRIIGDKYIHELTHADFYNYRRSRSKEYTRFKTLTKATTINREIAMARGTFNHIADAGFRMPERDDYPKWPELFDSHAEKSNARVRELQMHEELALFEKLQAKTPDLAIVAEFALLCGQRRTAVITLDRRNIDWVNKEFTLLLKTRGPNKRRHIVPLSPRMIEIIEAQPKVKGTDRVFTYVCRHGHKAYTDKRGRFFAERVKGQRYPFSADGWEKDWRNAVREAGIQDFCFHDMRHTAASRITRKTGNLNTTKQLLGHEDIKTTQRYAHVNTKDVLDALVATEQDTADKKHQVEVQQRRENIRVAA